MKLESLFSTGGGNIHIVACRLVVLTETKENEIKILGILAIVCYGFLCLDSKMLSNYY